MEATNDFSMDRKSRPITISLPADMLAALHKLAAEDSSARGWGHRATYADVIRRVLAKHIADNKAAASSKAGTSAARDIVAASKRSAKKAAPKKSSKRKPAKKAAKRRG